MLIVQVNDLQGNILNLRQLSLSGRCATKFATRFHTLPFTALFPFFLTPQFAMVGNRKASRQMKEMLQKW
ncbi:hypothetical protein [Pantoea cypripedii]|uniref:Uncharacterized protein n=1 Tax=Pantoea cypripedii TaxID=55209 RepID=A0A1X1EXH3_PANCY|nr:hypothetical protein [Pantoea cypripedii]MBP2194767.1 hypothetical protein [Pantoea cypripedii]ORM94631.1 hypothetical protein HA50_15265 [Pantoea cypripedii]